MNSKVTLNIFSIVASLIIVCLLVFFLLTDFGPLGFGILGLSLYPAKTLSELFCYSLECKLATWAILNIITICLFGIVFYITIRRVLAKSIR